MSTEKKLTSVEWLVIEIEKLTGLKIQDEDIINQAKELEKQQIIDACNAFGNLNGVDKEDFEQYYNETFKK